LSEWLLCRGRGRRILRIRFAASRDTILRYYIDMENGDLTRALARYNGSTGKTWYSERVLGRLSARWFQL